MAARCDSGLPSEVGTWDDCGAPPVDRCGFHPRRRRGDYRPGFRLFSRRLRQASDTSTARSGLSPGIRFQTPAVDLSGYVSVYAKRGVSV